MLFPHWSSASSLSVYVYVQEITYEEKSIGIGNDSPARSGMYLTFMLFNISLYRSQTKYQIVLTKTDMIFPIDVARHAMQIEEVSVAQVW